MFIFLLTLYCLIITNTILPGDGKRKKAVVQQTITMPSLHFTAALNKSEPPSFTSQRNDDHTLKITAALGGSRREANTASIQSGRN